MPNSTSDRLLTIESGGAPLNAQPSFFGDGLVNDAQDRHAISQQCYQCAKDWLACVIKSNKTHKEAHQASQAETIPSASLAA